MLMKEQNKKIIFYSVIGFLMFAGVFLRVLFYSYARPFWNDESALALNILNRSFLGLFSPLEYYQTAPPLFACLCKLVCKFCFLFANKAEYSQELILRFVPLLCSIGSLPLFYLLSKKLLKSKTAVVFSMILFSFNYPLVYYAQEFKQYSCDIFLFLGVLLLYFYIDIKKIRIVPLILLSVILALLPWISYTALIAEFVVFLLWFTEDKKRSIMLFLLPAISLLFLLPIIHNLDSNSYLQGFWADGFVAKDLSNLKILLKNNYIFYFIDFSNKLLLGLLPIAGMIAFGSEYKKRETYIVLLPLVLGVLLAYLNIYPIYLRTSLYLFPIFILLISKPLDFIKFKSEFLNYLVISYLFAYFAVCTLKTDFSQILLKQYYKETTPSLLQEFKNSSSKDDILIVTNLSRINFEMYKKQAELNENNVLLIEMPLYEKSEILRGYSLLPQNRTYYVLLTHSGDKKYELENLIDYVQSKKNSVILKDKDYNALLKFEN